MSSASRANAHRGAVEDFNGRIGRAKLGAIGATDGDADIDGAWAGAGVAGVVELLSSERDRCRWIKGAGERIATDGGGGSKAKAIGSALVLPSCRRGDEVGHGDADSDWTVTNTQTLGGDAANDRAAA